ncbi:phage head morphogenesis protein [Staphylococcus sp. GDY8P47P]|uniref:phage head morphogenesis protein n=1 Tax=Staphylococcus sp. GDY8P47P TaxID=2804491 RepID=UPI0031BBB2B6
MEDKQSLIRNTGALNDINDPYHSKRDQHAINYYKSVLNRNKKREIEVISNNTGYNQKLIERVYEHLFENVYELGNKRDKFFPDFNIALSWQRLREGKNIKEQDLILLRHEALEHYLMNK